jgi:MFS family permease
MASSSAIEWVVAGYGLTFATCLITAGRIGDRIGRRRAFTIGLTLFTITSVACGLLIAKNTAADAVADGLMTVQDTRHSPDGNIRSGDVANSPPAIYAPA